MITRIVSCLLTMPQIIIKYTTLEHSNETVGLCYQETSMYTPDCYDDIVCAHTRYCDGYCDEGYLLACTSDDQCDPLMRCMVVDGCDNNYQNCHDVTDVTLHYIDYDGDIPDHVVMDIVDTLRVK